MDVLYAKKMSDFEHSDLLSYLLESKFRNSFFLGRRNNKNIEKSFKTLNLLYNNLFFLNISKFYRLLPDHNAL